MRNPAVHDLPDHVALHPVVHERWSPRAFASKPLDPAAVASLIEAARWAASGGNAQPWRFVIGTKDTGGAGDATYTGLLDTLFPPNRAWAQDAPLLILATTRTTEPDGRPRTVGGFELGLAVGNLTAQAQALGLFVHQMGGFDAEAARATFSVPEDYSPVVVLAVGEYGDAESLPESFAARERAPRSRLPRQEIAFSGSWGNPWDTAWSEAPAA